MTPVLAQAGIGDVERILVAAAVAAFFAFLNNLVNRRAAREDREREREEDALSARLTKLETRCEQETKDNRHRIQNEIHARELQAERNASQIALIQAKHEQLAGRVDALEEHVGAPPSPRQTG